MANRTNEDSAWRNGFERTDSGSCEYFEMKVGQFLRSRPKDENSSLFTKSTMREDRQKANYANTLLGEIKRALNKFDDRDGNRDDAYEILLSLVSERAFKKYALNRFHLIDPLNPPTVGSEQN